MENNWIVYLLTNTDPKNNCTYLGVTNNSKNRLRKHNGEIKGGARYTKMKKGNGKWIYHLKAKGFTKSEALSIERTAKNLRKKAKGTTPLERRLNVLLPILKKKRTEKKSKRKRKRKREKEEEIQPKKREKKNK